MAGPTPAENTIAYDPFRYAIQDDPYPTYEALLESGPVYRNASRDFWALPRFTDIQAALRDRIRYSNAEGVNVEDFTEVIPPAGNFLDMDPPRHDQLRSILQSTGRFLPKRVAELGPFIESTASALLKPMISEGGGDLAEGYAHRLPVAVICELIGIPQSDGSLVKHWSDEIMRREPDDDSVTKTGFDAAQEMREYIEELVHRRRQDGQEDLATLVATARVDGKVLTRDEAVGMLFLLFTAGNTTTADLLSNSMVVLSRRPDQERLIRDDAVEVSRAVEELLRFESPVQYTSRVTTQEVGIADVAIPARSRVLLLFGAAHRDRRAFEVPARLDITRKPQRLLAFGEGIHHCIGAPIARLEATIGFSTLFRSAPPFEIIGKAKRIHDSHQRGIEKLPVEFGRGTN